MAADQAVAHHQHLAEHLKDGGIRSRKLWYGVGTSVSIVLISILAAWKLPALLPALEVVIGGLLAAYGIFVGANVGGKFTIGGAVAKNPSPAPVQPVQRPTPSPGVEGPPVEPLPPN